MIRSIFILILLAGFKPTSAARSSKHETSNYKRAENGAKSVMGGNFGDDSSEVDTAKTGEANAVLAVGNNRLSDDVVPLSVQLDSFPRRPKPLLEIGEPLLDTGDLREGFELPTGAVWQPSFIAWGTYRTALQSHYDGNDYISEWANRFDLFGNLYLTFTERILFDVRILDREGRFTGYTFDAPNENIGFHSELNFDLTTLFFEGDFGELFPFLDREDKYGLDFAFSVGRQPISFQQGILIDDTIDAIGVTKINLKPGGTVNLRTTFLWGGMRSIE